MAWESSTRPACDLGSSKIWSLASGNPLCSLATSDERSLAYQRARPVLAVKGLR
jgi:hypothetical protein